MIGTEGEAKPEEGFAFCSILGGGTCISKPFLIDVEDIGAFATDVVFVVMVKEDIVFIFTIKGAWDLVVNITGDFVVT
jgi:hypothetical protein